MNNLAIIPTRSGSKRLKNKNIKLLCGKPLVAYTIEAAVDSGVFDEVMVSTDSEEYAKIAIEYGAKVPFLRSEENSKDTASSWDTVLEVLEFYKQQNKKFNKICLLQPTSPLRDKKDIQGAYTELCELGAKAVVSVCEAEHTPALCNVLPESKDMEGFISMTSNKRRQDIGKFYRINGAIYFVDVDFLLENTFLYRKGCYGYIMEQSHSIDIDTELDFLMAKSVMEIFREDIPGRGYTCKVIYPLPILVRRCVA